MLNARGRAVFCQEREGDGFQCGASATKLIDNGDERPYWMCDQHAAHNVRNRRAVEYVKVVPPERKGE